MDESVQKHLAPELDEARKLVLRAAALIESEGFYKGAYGNSRMGHCVLGALHRAAKADPFSYAEDSLVHAAVDRLLVPALKSGPHFHLSDWNDAPDRTKDQVIAKLRAVALGG